LGGKKISIEKKKLLMSRIRKRESLETIHDLEEDIQNPKKIKHFKKNLDFKMLLSVLGECVEYGGLSEELEEKINILLKKTKVC
jgi:hypothetical protein